MNRRRRTLSIGRIEHHDQISWLDAVTHVYLIVSTVVFCPGRFTLLLKLGTVSACFCQWRIWDTHADRNKQQHQPYRNALRSPGAESIHAEGNKGPSINVQTFEAWPWDAIGVHWLNCSWGPVRRVRWTQNAYEILWMLHRAPLSGALQLPSLPTFSNRLQISCRSLADLLQAAKWELPLQRRGPGAELWSAGKSIQTIQKDHLSSMTHINSWI